MPILAPKTELDNSLIMKVDNKGFKGGSDNNRYGVAAINLKDEEVELEVESVRRLAGS